MTDEEILAAVFSEEFTRSLEIGGVPVVLRTLTTKENQEVLGAGQGTLDPLLKADLQNAETVARALVSINGMDPPETIEERVALVKGWKGVVVQMLGEAYIQLFNTERTALAALPKS